MLRDVHIITNPTIITHSILIFVLRDTKATNEIWQNPIIFVQISKVMKLFKLFTLFYIKNKHAYSMLEKNVGVHGKAH